MGEWTQEKSSKNKKQNEENKEGERKGFKNDKETKRTKEGENKRREEYDLDREKRATGGEMRNPRMRGKEHPKKKKFFKTKSTKRIT